MGVKEKIQPCCTAQEALHVFMSHSLKPELSNLSNSTTIDSQSGKLMNRDMLYNPLFFLLIGSSGSGKSYIFNSIQHDTTKFMKEFTADSIVDAIGNATGKSTFFTF